jgi:hypothetical protein
MPISIEVINEIPDPNIGGPIKLAALYPGAHVALRHHDKYAPGHVIIDCHENGREAEVYFIPDALLPADNVLPDAIGAMLAKEQVGPEQGLRYPITTRLGQATLVITHFKNPEQQSVESIADVLINKFE